MDNLLSTLINCAIGIYAINIGYTSTNKLTTFIMILMGSILIYYSIKNYNNSP